MGRLITREDIETGALETGKNPFKKLAKAVSKPLKQVTKAVTKPFQQLEKARNDALHRLEKNVLRPVGAVVTNVANTAVSLASSAGQVAIQKVSELDANQTLSTLAAAGVFTPAPSNPEDPTSKGFDPAALARRLAAPPPSASSGTNTALDVGGIAAGGLLLWKLLG
jgi:hypothetical protein